MPSDTDQRLRELVDKAILAADDREAERFLAEFVVLLKEHLHEARAILAAQALLIKELDSASS